MAFDKYKDGAWMEPETIVGKHESGAWEDAEAVKRDIDGAWAEVWANIKWMQLISKTITAGSCNVTEDGLKFEYVKEGNVSKMGAILLCVDGLWEGAEITFDVTGKHEYTKSGDSASGSAGKIQVYSRTVDGLVETTTVASTIIASTGRSYSCQLDGKFDRLGLNISISHNTGSISNSKVWVNISNVRINGRKIGFSDTVEFEL